MDNKKMRVAIITGGGRMGYTAEMLLDLERKGLCDVVIIDSNPTASSWVKERMNNWRKEVEGVWIDEFMPCPITPERERECSELSPKRKALIAQLERAKLRRDKNAVRDLTRQLEKVW